MIIKSVVKIKNGVKINDKYFIDDFYYGILLPYVGKEIKNIVEFEAFAASYNLLIKKYKKIFNHEISRKELFYYLTNNDIDIPKANVVIRVLKNNGYLDDNDFINHYKERFEETKGFKEFKRFLKKHLIDDMYILNISYKENNEAIEAIINKYKKQNNYSKNYLKQKIMSNLITKGFNLENISINLDDYDESLPLQKDYNKLKFKCDKKKLLAKLLAKGYERESIKEIMEDNIYEN